MTTRSEAETLHNQMDNLEVAFLTTMWDAILRRFQHVSEYLQKVEMDLSQAHELISSLRDVISGLHDQFDMFEERAKKMSQSVTQNYKADTQRTRRRKKQADELSGPDCDIAMSGRYKFVVNVFNVIIDKLVAEVSKRCEAYKELDNTFGFLNKVSELSPQQIRSSATLLQNKYSCDLQEDLVDEFEHFREYIRNTDVKSASQCLQLMRKRNIHTVFPNVDIALRLFFNYTSNKCNWRTFFFKVVIGKKQTEIDNGTRKTYSSDTHVNRK